jgi:predicted secreted hydrolase
MFYRASILDINETTNYWRIARVIDPSSGAVQPHEGTLNLTLDKYGFISVDKTKPLGAMRTWSTSNMVWFNLTFELSAPILLNGGIGTFQWGSEISYEWSMPAGLTYGSFIANGDWLTVDTAHSMTWYDRQIAWPHGPMDGPPRANWTWFEVHLNEQKMSIWIWDTQDHRRFQFATVREEPGVHQVLAVTDFIPSMRQWTSPISNATYSLDWVVSLGDETTLQLSSIRADQELCDPRGRIPTYGGYVNVTGMRDGRPLSGYGVVEIVPFSPH